MGLIGLNGAGKTTLLRILAGLLSSFQLDAALWEGRSFSFRDREFKRKPFYRIRGGQLLFLFYLSGVSGLRGGFPMGGFCRTRSRWCRAFTLRPIRTSF